MHESGCSSLLWSKTYATWEMQGRQNVVPYSRPREPWNLLRIALSFLQSRDSGKYLLENEERTVSSDASAIWVQLAKILVM